MVVDRQRKLVHDLASPGGDDLRAQNLAVAPVDDLDESAQILVGNGAVDAVKPPTGDPNVVIARKSLAGVHFRQATLCDFGLGEDCPGDVRAHTCARAWEEHRTHGHGRLPGRIVSELKAANHVAAGIDVLLAGLQVLVHLDTAFGVLHTASLEVEPFDYWAPPDRHQQRIRVDLLTAVGDDHRPAMFTHAADVGTEPEAHPLVFKDLTQDF